MRLVPRHAAVILLFILASATVPPAAGDDTTLYTLGILDAAYRPDHLDWTVVVVPPVAGPLANDDGVAAGLDPEDPEAWRDAYVDAAIAAVQAWEPAADAGPAWLADGLTIDVSAATDHSDPAAAIADADALVVLSPSYAYPGQAVPGSIAGKCVALIATNYIRGTHTLDALVPRSMTPEDIYNVVGHEFGHCLGIGHVESGPKHDLMYYAYAHPVGGSDAHAHCASNLDVIGLAAANQHLVGAGYGPDEVTIDAADYAVPGC